MRRPKPPPRKVVRDGDLLGLEAGHRRGHAQRAAAGTGSGRSDQHRVLAHVGGEVHRLHRRVRQERQLVRRLDRLAAAPSMRRVDVALLAGSPRPAWRAAASQRGRDRLSELSVVARALVPLDLRARRAPCCACHQLSATTATPSVICTTCFTPGHRSSPSRRRSSSTLPPITGHCASDAYSMPGSLHVDAELGACRRPWPACRGA